MEEARFAALLYQICLPKHHNVFLSFLFNFFLFLVFNIEFLPFFVLEILKIYVRKRTRGKTGFN